jgi:hypothetical protein
MSDRPTSLRKVIVVRNAPDWSKSANLWLTQKKIDPRLFLPDPLPASFPKNVQELIEVWNRNFNIDFFSIRLRIKQLSYDQFGKMSADTVITQSEFESDLENWTSNSILFFTDDDDFAHPNLFEKTRRLVGHSNLCIRWSSISLSKEIENRRVEQIFPRLRPWVQYQAELRPNKFGFLKPLVESKANIPGVKNALVYFPLHTNNYLMYFTDKSRLRVQNFIDHVSASKIIWQSPIKVESLEREWLSFTNKHPASISAFGLMIKGANNDDEIKSRMANYIASHQSLVIPDSLSWIEPIHRNICEIYRHLLA